MSSISFNARNGISVGAALPLSDSLGNVTAASLSVSGASTLGTVSLTSLNVSGAVAFSTSPTGITSAQNTNTLALATTAFVLGQKGTYTPLMNGTGYAGVSTLFSSQDHIHPSDTSLATNINPSFTGNVAISGGTVTTSSPFLSLTQTWNNSATTFNGIFANITNTTSNANSLLLNFQMNGIQQFGIAASGTLIQTVTASRLARTIISIPSELRTIREYQDLNDGLVGGTQGLDVNSVTEFSDTFNARWDAATSVYVKDRSLAGDHVSASRLTEDYLYQWYFSDGTAPTSTIAWQKRVEFNMPAAMYTFNGTLHTTNMMVSGNIAGSLRLTDNNAGIELGSLSTANTPFIDFHSSGGNIDYDARIIASLGNPTTIGLGNLTYTASGHYFTGVIAAGVWNGSAIPVTNGGTGASSQTTALTNLMPSGATSGYVLTTSGAGSYYWASPTGSTAPVGNIIQSTRTLATATAGQTVFATPTYTPGSGQLRIYINGIRQFSTEYTETTATSFTLTAPGATLNDVVFIEIDGYINYTWSALATTFTPTGLITSTNVQAAIADLEARKASHTDSLLIGTTSIALNRASAVQTLTGISIDGNAATANNALSLGGNLANTYAPLVSPGFSGTPTVPTATVGDNSTQIASTAFVQANILVSKPYVSGTRTSFNQTAAPTGWTKDTTAALNDSVMRIVTGTVGSGGSYAFSSGCTVVAAHTHGWSGTSSAVSNDHTHSGSTGTESAYHNHSIPSNANNGNAGTTAIYSSVAAASYTATSGNQQQLHTHAFTTGGISANHTHTVSGTTADSNNSGVWIPKYYDFIIATIN